ncbi:MAG: helix-turn-helix domain-containing protein [Thermodesulfobacteriota bacterium]
MAIKPAESQNVELKCNWRDEYLKVICSFANADGGRLMVGVDDKGKPIGVENAKKLLEDVPNKIKDVLGIIPKVMTEGRKGKDTIVIEIRPSHAPISYHGRYFVRSGSTVQEIKGKELTKFLISRSDRDWDEYAEEKGAIKDIDTGTVRRFRELAIKRLPFVKDEKDNLKLLQKLNLIENGKLKRAAILLFGKNPKRFYTSAYIKIGKFLTDTDIVASDDVEGNLFEQVEKAIELLRTKYLLSEIRFEGIYRKEEMEYPEEALREAIINAAIHRDYIGAHT